MTSTTASPTNAAPAYACAPANDRDGEAMPENIARLLYVIRVLLSTALRIADAIETGAEKPRVWLLRLLFRTARAPVMLAHLRRAILRAAALESLLLAQAATGQDIPAVPHPEPRETDPNASPCDELFHIQIKNLYAERAQHDTPAKPRKLATPEAIESEVRARAIGRSIDEIRRDIGVVAILCTPEFWNELTSAIADFPQIPALSVEPARRGPQNSLKTTQPSALQPLCEPLPQQTDPASDSSMCQIPECNPASRPNPPGQPSRNEQRTSREQADPHQPQRPADEPQTSRPHAESQLPRHPGNETDSEHIKDPTRCQAARQAPSQPAQSRTTPRPSKTSRIRNGQNVFGIRARNQPFGYRTNVHPARPPGRPRAQRQIALPDHCNKTGKTTRPGPDNGQPRSTDSCRLRSRLHPAPQR